MIASTLSGLIAFVFASIGVGSFANPTGLAASYGLPVETDTGIAYARALGARDLILGAIVAVLAAARVPRSLLGNLINVIALVGLADFVLVASTRESRKSALLLHGGGTLGLVIAAAIVKADP